MRRPGACLVLLLVSGQLLFARTLEEVRELAAIFQKLPLFQ